MWMMNVGMMVRSGREGGDDKYLPIAYICRNTR